MITTKSCYTGNVGQVLKEVFCDECNYPHYKWIDQPKEKATMKVIINNEDQKEKEEFPRLMQYKEDAKDKLIVLFTSKQHGTVLKPGLSEWRTGQHNIHWLIQLFEPFDGKITLEND